ncbi:unnamed protein product [Gordionus sp. m RMFG-2023]
MTRLELWVEEFGDVDRTDWTQGVNIRFICVSVKKPYSSPKDITLIINDENSLTLIKLLAYTLLKDKQLVDKSYQLSKCCSQVVCRLSCPLKLDIWNCPICKCDFMALKIIPKPTKIKTFKRKLFIDKSRGLKYLHKNISYHS